ncbi:MAG TPA: folate-binding protein [Ottowia sp.]|uniref:CAF17-like 4Fe-4S cluster assembly/insertion protein YgfZ n=1 Tax=Ottowia sp. TaxID=1898956 RepID=UPI002CD24BB0|nr:folate-binding protein [Ottowia sp.]HMN22414.1 folate-binding protein [Ottowia sp.]
MIIEPMDMPATQTHSAAALPAGGVAPLAHLGVIRARGEQAGAFLQGLLTQEMEQLPVGQGRLAALCSAKGRVLASFVACRQAPDEFLLVCSEDLLTETLRQLARFVLRSKVRLDEATADFKLRGLLGRAASQAQPGAARNGAVAPLTVPLAPADAVQRALWLAPLDAVEPVGAALAGSDWAFAEVRSGVATVAAATAGQFVPQMLNYESVGGVSFRKGCYPGQEVVARSQFRGAVKRRAFVAQVAGPAQAGDEVFAVEPAGTPCGLIVQAAPAPDGGTAVIAVLGLSAVESGQALTLGVDTGAPLRAPRLPYPLLDI